MSVAAGLAVMAAMFEAEIAEVCGPRASTTRTRPRCAMAPVRGRWPWAGGGCRWTGRGRAPSMARGAVSQLHPLRRR